VSYKVSKSLIEYLELNLKDPKKLDSIVTMIELEVLISRQQLIAQGKEEIEKFIKFSEQKLNEQE